MTELFSRFSMVVDEGEYETEEENVCWGILRPFSQQLVSELRVSEEVSYALWLQLGLIFHIKNEYSVDCFVYNRIIYKLGLYGYDVKNSKYTSMRFDVEKYDGRINFGLWQIQVKDVLIQSGLHKALKGKPAPISNTESSAAGKDDDEEWDDLDLRAESAIRLSLAKNVLANVHGISTAKDLWEKLEQLYQGKGISNRLYLKEQFHTLRMNGDTKISDHLSFLNNIVSELEAISVKVEDKDKAWRLILSLPSSYEHMKPILMYGKETLKYADVTGKLLSEVGMSIGKYLPLFSGTGTGTASSLIFGTGTGTVSELLGTVGTGISRYPAVSSSVNYENWNRNCRILRIGTGLAWGSSSSGTANSVAVPVPSSEEKRLESSFHTSSSEGMVLVCGKGKKKIFTDWRCGQSGHVKRNCPGGADSVKGSDTANNVSVVVDGDDFF
ncbi:hypothetical protein LXL04_015435 [Taraxacum kok-saghyz]